MIRLVRTCDRAPLAEPDEGDAAALERKLAARIFDARDFLAATALVAALD